MPQRDAALSSAPTAAAAELAVVFAVPGRAVLERLASEPLPFPAGPAAPPQVYRDVYYDTPAAELRRRGAVVGVRFHPGGELTLAVELREAEGRARRAEVQQAAEGRAEALFAVPGPAAHLLRALVDPARLEPWLEVETSRRERQARVGELPLVLACDQRTVRDREVSAELFELEARLPHDLAELRQALRELEAPFGLTLLTGDPLLRWTRSLEESEVDWLEEAVRASRRVAVVALRAGRVAVLERGDGVLLPQGPGTGIDAARTVLREALGEGRVRLLGTGPGSPRQPATEVWLCDDAPELGAGREVRWVAADTLLSRAGSPPLRDPATLAALQVLARSGLPLHPPPDAWEEAEETAPALALGTPAARAATLEPAAELPPGTLLNPELSVLAFNRRVLDLAADEGVPLLERLRFLSIFGGNLDEFFRVRVATYKRQVAQGVEKAGLDGVLPRAQLDALGARARRLTDAAYRLLFDQLLPALRAQGVEVVRRSQLTASERGVLAEWYERELHPLLTPLAAGGGHPFPHIRNQRPAVAALLREPLTGSERLGIVELPDGPPRFVPLGDGGRRVALETAIIEQLERLYPGHEVEAAAPFRVTRSAELLLEPGTGADLLQAVAEELQRRRSRPVVRVEVDDAMTPRLRALLLRELRHEAPAEDWPLTDEDVYAVEGMLDLRSVRELAALPLAGAHWPPEEPRDPLPQGIPITQALAGGEVLVEFPRDSFEATVERFVLEAAEDPAVVAIKLALYRTNRRSRIVEALRRASAAGKQVVALVELTARFDEERNIEWARYLRSAGIQVVYGLPGLKVHAKVALAVRREAQGVRRYAYVGTGNLNATTAAAYTDLGLLTADPGITAEVGELFNHLTGGGAEPRFRSLLVAPLTMSARFLELIERETRHALAGRAAEIVAKVNGLADREIIAALYRASRAGVRVDLIVRSLCALRPGVAGLSDHIRVVSILGRYLEHARIFRFANAGQAEYYIGSADWRTRNLSRRVEVACPVRDPEHRARLDALLAAQLADPRAWELGCDGTYYRRPHPAPREAPLPTDGARQPFITG